MKNPLNPRSLELADWEAEVMRSGRLNFLRRPADYVLNKINSGDQIHLIHKEIITPPRVVGIRYETVGETDNDRWASAAEEEGWFSHPLSYRDLWNQTFGATHPFNDNLQTAQLKLTWII